MITLTQNKIDKYQIVREGKKEEKIPFVKLQSRFNKLII